MLRKVSLASSASVSSFAVNRELNGQQITELVNLTAASVEIYSFNSQTTQLTLKYCIPIPGLILCGFPLWVADVDGDQTLKITVFTKPLSVIEVIYNYPNAIEVSANAALRNLFVRESTLYSAVSQDLKCAIVYSVGCQVYFNGGQRTDVQYNVFPRAQTMLDMGINAQKNLFMLYKNVLNQTFLQLFRLEGTTIKAISQPMQTQDNTTRAAWQGEQFVLLFGAKISALYQSTGSQMQQIVLPISEPICATSEFVCDCLGKLVRLQYNSNMTDINGEVVARLGQLTSITHLRNGVYFGGGFTGVSCLFSMQQPQNSQAWSQIPTSGAHVLQSLSGVAPCHEVIAIQERLFLASGAENSGQLSRISESVSSGLSEAFEVPQGFETVRIDPLFVDAAGGAYALLELRRVDAIADSEYVVISSRPEQGEQVVEAIGVIQHQLGFIVAAHCLSDAIILHDDTAYQIVKIRAGQLFMTDPQPFRDGVKCRLATHDKIDERLYVINDQNVIFSYALETDQLVLKEQITCNIPAATIPVAMAMTDGRIAIQLDNSPHFVIYSRHNNYCSAIGESTTPALWDQLVGKNVDGHTHAEVVSYDQAGKQFDTCPLELRSAAICCPALQLEFASRDLLVALTRFEQLYLYDLSSQTRDKCAKYSLINIKGAVRFSVFGERIMVETTQRRHIQIDLKTRKSSMVAGKFFPACNGFGLTRRHVAVSTEQWHVETAVISSKQKTLINSIVEIDDLIAAACTQLNGDLIDSDFRVQEVERVGQFKRLEPVAVSMVEQYVEESVSKTRRIHGVQFFDQELNVLDFVPLSEYLITKVIAYKGYVIALQATEEETGILTTITRDAHGRYTVIGEISLAQAGYDMTVADDYLAVALLNQVLLYELREDQLLQLNRANYNVLITSIMASQSKLYILDLIRGLTIIPIKGKAQFGAPKYYQLVSATALQVVDDQIYVGTAEGKLLVLQEDEQAGGRILLRSEVVIGDIISCFCRVSGKRLAFATASGQVGQLLSCEDASQLAEMSRKIGVPGIGSVVEVETLERMVGDSREVVESGAQLAEHWLESWEK